MWRYALALILFTACLSPQPWRYGPDVADELDDQPPPTDVRIVVHNNYSGTAMLHMRLVSGWNEVVYSFGTLYANYQTFRFHAIQPLSGMYIRIEAKYEETWWSEDLFFVQPGDCISINIGQLPKYSGVRMCNADEFKR